MFKLLKKVYSLSDVNKNKLNISILLQFIDSFLSFIPVGAALMFYRAYVEGTLDKDTPLELFVMLFAGVLIRIFVKFYVDKLQYTTVYTIFTDERVKISDHLRKVKMGYYTDKNIGKATTTLTNGIAFIEEHGIQSVITVLTSITSIVIVSISLSVLNLYAGLTFIATILLVSIVIYFYNKEMSNFTNLNNEANASLTSAIIEYVKNISVIKAFNLLGKHEISNKAIKQRREVDLYGEKVNIPYICSTLIIMALSTAAMIYLSVKGYVEGSSLLYNVIITSIFSLYAFRSLESILFKVLLINISVSQLDLIDELYNEEVIEVKDNKVPKDYSIEFENVSFAYEEEDVIQNISFKLKENTMNALVGLSGSGKSTIVNLIPRFYDIEQGSIKIGGVDIKEMSEETLYDSISMVFQNVYLFKDTIYNNIVFGNDNATKEDVIKACKDSRCYDFIMELPNGFDTMVGEAGLSLSGGERQRISIARAILKDSPIILLDEATASIDPDNEFEIQEAINNLVKDKTLIVIAHKLSCVNNSDKILVIKDGKLISQGKHSELLETSEIYSSLWEKRKNSKSWKILN